MSCTLTQQLVSHHHSPPSSSLSPPCLAPPRFPLFLFDRQLLSSRPLFTLYTKGLSLKATIHDEAGEKSLVSETNSPFASLGKRIESWRGICAWCLKKPIPSSTFSSPISSCPLFLLSFPLFFPCVGSCFFFSPSMPHTQQNSHVMVTGKGL